ncbi:RNA polymerase sigma factor [Streptococcus ovuberis]|uniref:RNA polymerase sigma factor n=1 Tax=Streptococcus ovuberis TaxID=1936207 RepID=A0A7X6S1W9_9STRE|nr:RNA polymerase sigma factor [Streptococcus ovuberis]NKZ21242.1 RNA polymerase sigma factor [Streptococcus ovuberis]
MKLDRYEMELVVLAEEIVHYLIKSGVSQSDAYDVTQDVLVKMLEGKFALPREKMRAWMYRVAVRLYIDRYRREKTYQELLQRDFFKEELIVTDNQDSSELYDMLTELPAKYRWVLELYYFQGFSVKEISRILQISQSKVKIDLMRGRKQLKQWITERGLTYEDLLI